MSCSMCSIIKYRYIMIACSDRVIIIVHNFDRVINFSQVHAIYWTRFNQIRHKSSVHLGNYRLSLYLQNHGFNFKWIQLQNAIQRLFALNLNQQISEGFSSCVGGCDPRKKTSWLKRFIELCYLYSGSKAFFTNHICCWQIFLPVWFLKH